MVQRMLASPSVAVSSSGPVVSRAALRAGTAAIASSSADRHCIKPAIATITAKVGMKRFIRVTTGSRVEILRRGKSPRLRTRAAGFTEGRYQCNLASWRRSRFPQRAGRRAVQTRRLHKTIRQGFHERDQIVFLGVTQAEIANGHIFVVRIFRRRPAVYFLHGSRTASAGDKCSRISVAGVVKVDHFLEAEQIAVVHVGLDEAFVRHLADIADRRGLELALKKWQLLSPGLIWRSAVVSVQEKTYSLVSEANSQGIARETPLIREVLRVPRQGHVPRQADIVVRKVAEQRSDVRGCTTVGSRGCVGSAVDVTGIALRFAVEKGIATLFLRGKSIGGCKKTVKFRS